MVPVTGRGLVAALRPWARRALFAGLAGVVVALGARQAVSASSEAALLEAGKGLLVYGGAESQDSVRTLRFNGVPLLVTTGTTPDSVERVLDAQRQACRAGATGPDTALGKRDEGRGFAACGIPSIDFTDLSQARATLEDMVGEGAGVVGPIRYVYAERRADTTVFVSLSMPRVDIDELLPHQGDAVDASPEPLRPPDGRLALSFREEGQDFLFTVFTGGSASPAASRDALLGDLEAHGFRVVARRQDGSDRASVLASRGDDMVLVSAQRRRSGGETSTAIVRAGARQMRELTAPSGATGGTR